MWGNREGWQDDLEDQARRRIAWFAGIVAVAALAAGGWYWFSSRQTPAPPAAVAPTPPPTAPPSAEPPVANPVPQTGSAALPALNDSDSLVQEGMNSVLGRAAVEALLVPQNIVRHIVVTVDNLPRRKVAVELRPVKVTPGQTVVSTQGEITTLSEGNYARYAPLVRVVQAADVKALAGLYQRLYPLFQQAYEDLGYPGKYFNDRLIEVIDHLIATPEPVTPIVLRQPKVFWEYADPELEGRSAGQKLLIRMGAAHARVIKTKLREFRDEVAQKK